MVDVGPTFQSVIRSHSRGKRPTGMSVPQKDELFSTGRYGQHQADGLDGPAERTVNFALIHITRTEFVNGPTAKE